MSISPRTLQTKVLSWYSAPHIHLVHSSSFYHVENYTCSCCHDNAGRTATWQDLHHGDQIWSSVSKGQPTIGPNRVPVTVFDTQHCVTRLFAAFLVHVCARLVRAKTRYAVAIVISLRIRASPHHARSALAAVWTTYQPCHFMQP